MVLRVIVAAIVLVWPLILGSHVVRDFIRCRKRRERTTGTVVELRIEARWHERYREPHPYVRFSDARGAVHTFRSPQGWIGVSLWDWRTWKVGDTVAVDYDPDDPENADLAAAYFGPAKFLLIMASLTFGVWFVGRGLLLRP